MTVQPAFSRLIKARFSSVLSGLVALLVSVDAIHAQTYTANDLSTLFRPASSATAINNSGQLVGNTVTANGHVIAFLYSGGTVAYLGTFGGLDSFAYAINDSGQVVGEARIPAAPSGHHMPFCIVAGPRPTWAHSADRIRLPPASTIAARLWVIRPQAAARNMPFCIPAGP
jgi:probable HAF family extracellular repeat protein